MSAEVLTESGDVLVDGKVLGPMGGDVNKPLYKPQNRSGFKGMPLPDGTVGLHKKNGFVETARHAIKDEQGWHRMAAYMFLAGRTNSEVAMAAGVSTGHVAMLKGQQWFQELLATLANNEGDEIIGLLKGEAQNSILKLVALRDNAEKESVQLTAATTLLEHANGKATQRVISQTVPSTFVSEQDEYEQLQNELRILRQRNSVTVNSREADEETAQNSPLGVLVENPTAIELPRKSPPAGEERGAEHWSGEALEGQGGHPQRGAGHSSDSPASA